MHVAGAEQADELIAEMVAVEQDEDDEDDDDADGEDRMQQRRHERGDALEIGCAACTRTAGAAPAGRRRGSAERGDHGHEAAESAAALGQAAYVVDLLLQVCLVAGQAAGDLGELRHDQGGSRPATSSTQHDHGDRDRQRRRRRTQVTAGLEDEGEKDGDRSRDQHIATGIERGDRHRGDGR